MSQFKVVGFDLDGTLVNSLPDLALAVNSALAEQQLPPAPQALVLTWIGNGAPILIGRALEWVQKETGQILSDEVKDRIRERFSHFYG